MKVEGHEIPPSTVTALEQWVAAQKTFKFYELATFASKHGIPNRVCDRLADRILQRLKLDGAIEYRNRVWTRREPTPCP